MPEEPRDSDRSGLDDSQLDRSILNRSFDQAMRDKETLHRWDEEQDHEHGTDTDRAVKLAAIRTEFLQRVRASIKTTE
jgi:hypothetical protein